MKRAEMAATASALFALMIFHLCLAASDALGFVRARSQNGAEYAWDLESSQERLQNLVVGKVAFVINRLASGDVTDGSDLKAIRKAFGAWASIPTSRIDFLDLGLTDRTAIGRDETNLVLWRTDESLGIGVLAVTTVSFFLSSRVQAEIIDADIQFNGANFRWTTSAEPGKIDIEGVATHEVGHLVGLDHSFVRESTMFPSGSRRAEEERSLEVDDAAGASAIYPEELFAATTGIVTGKVVFGRSAPSGEAAPIEPDDSPPLAARIGFGDTVEATIGAPGDLDFYAFDGLAGDRVIASIEASVAGSLLDPVLVLLDGDGQTVLAQNDDFDGLDPRLVFDLPRSGRFFLGVTGAEEGVGGDDFFYRLSLNTVFGAHVVAFDASSLRPAVGAIADKAGKYALVGLPPGDYLLKAEPISPSELERYYARAFTDFRSSLYDGTSDFDSARIVTVSPSSVVPDVDIVVGRPDEADPFEPDDSPSAATAIKTDGTPQLHHFFPAGDEDFVKFNALEGENYIIETSGLAPLSDTFLTVFDLDGRTVLSSNDDIDLGVNLASRISFVPEGTGTYFAIVRHFLREASGARTDYSISVRHAPFAIAMRPRRFAGNPFDFTLSIRAPGAVSRLRPESFRFMADRRDLTKPFLSRVELNFLSEDRVVFSVSGVTLPRRVFELETSIEDVDGRAAFDLVTYGQELASGEPTAGEIELPGSVNEFLFQGAAGDVVDIVVDRAANQPDGSGTLDPVLELIAPNGLSLAENDDGGGDSPPGPGRNARIAGFSLPATGRYMVVVRGFSSTYGPFSLFLDLSRP